MRPADDVKLDVVGLPQLLLRCSLIAVLEGFRSAARIAD